MTNQENQSFPQGAENPPRPVEPPADDGESASLPKEFFWFLRENKKWWLIPLIVVFVLIGVLIFIGTTPVAPFIYTFF